MAVGIATTYLDFQFYAFETPELPESNDPFNFNEDGSVDLNVTGIATFNSDIKILGDIQLFDDSGLKFITLKAPDVLSGIGTYTFPDTSTIIDGHFLKVSSDGQLSWQAVSSNASFSNVSLSGVTTIFGALNVVANSNYSGINTFTNTTNNTLGNSNTGAVQIDGGLGVDKNVTVGENLKVKGFIGIGSLFVDDCYGESQVISCANSERLLQNIVIDCGFF